MGNAKPKVKVGKKNASSKVLHFLVLFSIVVSFTVLVLVIGQVMMRGVPFLSPELFSPQYTTDNVSMVPAIVNTLEMIAIALSISVPLGVMTGIYMVEYAKPGNKLVKFTRLMTETLQGIPSIIFGLFGMIFFVNALGWGNSILVGSLTMAMMCLPLVIRSTEEALLAVPLKLREASYGLGARKLRTTVQIVLPAASMGIFAGIILSIGRIIGETAALIYTTGTMAQYATPLMNGRTLSIHMYMLQTEGIHKDQAYATAVILLIVVFILNAISAYIEGQIKKKEEGE